MSNFNQYFKKTGAGIMVDKFFAGIDLYDKVYKMTDLKWHIDNEVPKPSTYYIENGLTATFKVIVEYKINNKPEVLTTSFEVPMEIDGVFIIEGAYRIATNTLNSDYDCRIRMSGTGAYIINFDYDRRYDIAKKVLTIKRINPDLGLQENVKSIRLDDIDNQTGPEKELLKLSERQQKKFMIKLDLDYKPEYISKRLIEDCLAFGDDRTRDLIIDKKIDSVPQGFMNFLFGNRGKNYFPVRRTMSSYWVRFHKLQDPVNSITNLCIKHWKGSSDNSKGGSEIQVPPGINALNITALSSKIQIPKTVAFNKTFTDLIDIADTPINQNSNIQNALTVSTHLTDDGVLFDVLSLKYQKVTIDYLDYLNSKVVASEYVDYDKKELKPNKEGKVEVKYRMRRRMVDPKEANFIDLPPDYRLSQTMRRIPFVNFTDSVRLEMGTSMLKQSIPLPNAERSLVDTGNELESNVLNEKFRYPKGKVKDITEDNIVIELPDKDIINIPRRTAIQGANDVDIYIEPKVKKGQTIKEGDIVAGPVGLSGETYKSGINALVLFHAMFGYVDEDAVVVSESFANKMCHYSLIDITMDIKNSSAIKWIAPIGTKVKYHDSIMTVYKAQRLDELNRRIKDQLGGILGDLEEFTVEDSLKVPNNIDEAWVSDVMIQENLKPYIPRSVKKPDTSFSKSSEAVIQEYEKKKNRKIIYDKFPEYVAADTLDPVSMEGKSYKIVYTVRIRLIKKTTLMKGSKVTNRYGGKGVISKILPDELMPIIKYQDGRMARVDVVMNPYSTISRKIPSVLMESGLGSIAHKIHDLVDEYKTSASGKKKIMPMIEKYYPRYSGMDVDDFIKLHDTHRLEDVYYFNVGSYSTKFTPSLVTQWMEELGVESQSKVLIPQTELADLDELKANLSEDAYNKALSKMKGKYTEVDKPLMCGYITMLELFKIPYYDEKVTSSLFGVGPGMVNEFKDSPILGHGEYRKTGQAIGEMELSAYLARNVKPFIEYSRGDTAKQDSLEFINNLLGLGLTIQDDAGYNLGGSGGLKDRLNQMKVKFRVKKK